MVEQLTLNQRVGGSSPPRFTKLPVLFLLSRDSILSPLESVDLDIEFLAHTTTPKGWPVLFYHFLRCALIGCARAPNGQIRRRWNRRRQPVSLGNRRREHAPRFRAGCLNFPLRCRRCAPGLAIWRV